MIPATALVIGDVSEEATFLLAAIPLSADSGTTLRVLRVLAAAELGSADGYWTLQIGSFATGRYVVHKEIQFVGGFPDAPRAYDFGNGLRMAAGDTFAVRLVPTGAPPPIVAMSLAPEWGILGARR